MFNDFNDNQWKAIKFSIQIINNQWKSIDNHWTSMETIENH